MLTNDSPTPALYASLAALRILLVELSLVRQALADELYHKSSSSSAASKTAKGGGGKTITVSSKKGGKKTKAAPEDDEVRACVLADGWQ